MRFDLILLVFLCNITLKFEYLFPEEGAYFC